YLADDRVGRFHAVQRLRHFLRVVRADLLHGSGPRLHGGITVKHVTFRLVVVLFEGVDHLFRLRQRAGVDARDHQCPVAGATADPAEFAGTEDASGNHLRRNAELSNLTDDAGRLQRRTRDVEGLDPG